MYKLIGMVGGVAAGLAVAIFVSQCIASGFLETVVPGGIVGYLVWSHFAKKADAQLQELLHPPDEVWPVPLPIAWGCIKDVLDNASIATGTGGTSNWRIKKEDDSRGIIRSQLNFSEMLGGPTTGQVHPRTVEVEAILTPEGSSTKVHLQYDVFSPMGEGTVSKIVAQTHQAFKNVMEANKTA